MIHSEDFRPQNVPDEKTDPIRIGDVVAKYLYYWPVLLICIITTLFTALIYLRYSEPIYSVTSTLLIKDDRKGGVAGASDLLNELDVFGSSKVVDNEIEILKSRTLMHEVVKRLNLTISYKAVGRVKTADLYTSRPVNVQIIEFDKSLFGRMFLLSFPDSLTFVLKDEKSGKFATGRLGKIEKGAFGTFLISRNEEFQMSQSPITITFEDPLSVTDHYLSQLSVALASKQSTVLSLSFMTTVPRKGADILNMLVQVYNEAAIIEKNKTTASTMQFIDERLKLISGELTSVEKDVEGFKSSRGLTDLSSDANLFLESVKSNDAKLNEINLQISIVQDIIRYVNSNTTGEKLPSTLGIDDPVLLSQITQLGELQLKRDQVLSTTTASNPIVAPLLKQIETTRAGILSSVRNIHASLMTSRSKLESNNLGFQKSIKQIPGQERELISIKRQQSIKESLYLYLLQKKEEAALSYASAISDSRTVDPAYFSGVPVKPKKQMIYLGAFLAGLFIAIAYVYVKGLLATKVENVQEVRKLTSAPILAEIPYYEASESIVVLENARTAIAESFRSLRTNMQYLHAKSSGEQGKVTLITSSMSGEGKSFVATNLAAALALSGKKTVLLELDLRKPKISSYLQLSNKIGLSNYLIGQATIDDILNVSITHQNLFIISSGPIPPNPSELLARKDIDVLVSTLQQSFDEIIIDTPPVGLVTDAQILSRLAHVSIYMVRQGVTYKTQIKQVELLYEADKFPKFNVIVNGVSSNGAYGYGSGYGYYSEEVNTKRNNLKSLLNNLRKRF